MATAIFVIHVMGSANPSDRRRRHSAISQSRNV
jgi:hypothetical protein